MGRGMKGCPANLLSDLVKVVIRLRLEVAVVGPDVDRDADARYAALVDLPFRQRTLVITLAAVSWRILTSSAASGPAIENSRSAYLKSLAYISQPACADSYFFQYPMQSQPVSQSPPDITLILPKNSGKRARNRS